MTMLKALLSLLKPVLRAAVELLFFAPIWLTLGLYTLDPDSIGLLVALLLVIYCVPQYMFQAGKSMKNGIRLLLILMLGMIPIGAIALFFPDGTGALSMLAGGAIGIAFAASSFHCLSRGWSYSF